MAVQSHDGVQRLDAGLDLVQSFRNTLLIDNEDT